MWTLLNTIDLERKLVREWKGCERGESGNYTSPTWQLDTFTVDSKPIPAGYLIFNEYLNGEYVLHSRLHV